MSVDPIAVEPALRGARLALVFGGTFDPPHRAHVALPALVREAVGADAVIYVPAARSPHKGDGPVAPGGERMEMLRLALAGEAWAVVSDVELRRGADGPSYTVDTLRELGAALPGVRLRLLMGADQAAAFARWREPEEIVRLAEPVVMLRAPLESEGALMDVLRERWGADAAAPWRARIVAVPTLDAEATEIRERLRRDPLDPALDRLVPAAVLGHIRARGLYR
ncbi:MAG: nicotinate (nicotinamide) nucleotide adenylyltransferase [Phycisphaerales bacterium]|nr:nicotinate (nicotinamide) nucleotide adenylyltransferase [Phycisphaerales bacterium]